MNDPLSAQSTPPAVQAPSQPYHDILVGSHRRRLTDKQFRICQLWISSGGNISEVTRVVNKEFHRNHKRQHIKAWIDEDALLTKYLEDELGKKAEVEAFKDTDWRLLGIDVMKGRRTMDAIQVQVWKEWGKQVNGSEGGQGNTMNLQINFTEKNG